MEMKLKNIMLVIFLLLFVHGTKHDENLLRSSNCSSEENQSTSNFKWITPQRSINTTKLEESSPRNREKRSIQTIIKELDTDYYNPKRPKNKTESEKSKTKTIGKCNVQILGKENNTHEMKVMTAEEHLRNELMREGYENLNSSNTNVEINNSGLSGIIVTPDILRDLELEKVILEHEKCKTSISPEIQNTEVETAQRINTSCTHKTRNMQSGKSNPELKESMNDSANSKMTKVSSNEQRIQFVHRHPIFNFPFNKLISGKNSNVKKRAYVSEDQDRFKPNLRHVLSECSWIHRLKHQRRSKTRCKGYAHQMSLPEYSVLKINPREQKIPSRHNYFGQPRARIELDVPDYDPKIFTNTIQDQITYRYHYKSKSTQPTEHTMSIFKEYSRNSHYKLGGRKTKDKTQSKETRNRFKKKKNKESTNLRKSTDHIHDIDTKLYSSTSEPPTTTPLVKKSRKKIHKHQIMLVEEDSTVSANKKSKTKNMPTEDKNEDCDDLISITVEEKTTKKKKKTKTSGKGVDPSSTPIYETEKGIKRVKGYIKHEHKDNCTEQKQNECDDTTTRKEREDKHLSMFSFTNKRKSEDKAKNQTKQHSQHNQGKNGHGNRRITGRSNAKSKQYKGNPRNGLTLRDIHRQLFKISIPKNGDKTKKCGNVEKSRKLKLGPEISKKNVHYSSIKYCETTTTNNKGNATCNNDQKGPDDTKDTVKGLDDCDPNETEKLDHLQKIEDAQPIKDDSHVFQKINRAHAERHKGKKKEPFSSISSNQTTVTTRTHEETTYQTMQQSTQYQQTRIKGHEPIRSNSFR